MWRDERNTVRRGRSGVPFTFCRIRMLRRSLASRLVFMGSPLARAGAGLADLATDRLLDVLHTLALVGLGRPLVADDGRQLSQHLAIDAGQLHAVLLHLGRDAL